MLTCRARRGLALLLLLASAEPVHGRLAAPGRTSRRTSLPEPTRRQRVERAAAGVVTTVVTTARAAPPWVRTQLERVPEEWKQRLRFCRAQLERCLAVVWQRPRASLALALALRLLVAHVRIQASKRAGLSAFRELLAQTPPVYHVTIVTTAALPWKTGTAVNALLRAAYLAELGHSVTLCVPWIHPEEQALVFPGGMSCPTPEAQAALMREWLAARDGEHRRFEVCFYPARYDVPRGSILPLGDATRWVGEGPRDLCVLEEPEHLTWYHGGANWRREFKLVVGVVHTNYIMYASIYQPENVFIVRWFNELCCRAYIDRVVKLSDCLQKLPRSTVCNVHGVRAEFIAEGRRRAESGNVFFAEGAYFIGKLLWAKGHQLLIDYLAGETPPPGARRTRVDVYGDGEDRPDVEAKVRAAGLDVRFLGGRDHADASLHAYKVFVNPSRTEVLSTTTAEALAMGKFVVIERHPSNDFFYAFSNTLVYSTPEEFRAALAKALASNPAPLTPEESRALSWAGATERFVGAVAQAAELATPPSLASELAHLQHRSLSGHRGYLGDALKKFVFESGPISRQRWLSFERRWRTCTDPEEVVAKSCEIIPPAKGQSWAERYGGEKQSWTRFIPFLGGRKAGDK